MPTTSTIINAIVYSMMSNIISVYRNVYHNVYHKHYVGFDQVNYSVYYKITGSNGFSSGRPTQNPTHLATRPDWTRPLGDPTRLDPTQ